MDGKRVNIQPRINVKAENWDPIKQRVKSKGCWCKDNQKSSGDCETEDEKYSGSLDLKDVSLISADIKAWVWKEEESSLWPHTNQN